MNRAQIHLSRRKLRQQIQEQPQNPLLRQQLCELLEEQDSPSLLAREQLKLFQCSRFNPDYPYHTRIHRPWKLAQLAGGEILTLDNDCHIFWVGAQELQLFLAEQELQGNVCPPGELGTASQELLDELWRLYPTQESPLDGKRYTGLWRALPGMVWGILATEHWKSLVTADQIKSDLVLDPAD